MESDQEWLTCISPFHITIDGPAHKQKHVTVACLVAWPLNESEAGGDIVLIETFLLFLC